MKPAKVIGIFFLIVIIANLILFALRLIPDIVFWSVIVVAAVFAYWVLPRLKKP